MCVYYKICIKRKKNKSFFDTEIKRLFIYLLRISFLQAHKLFFYNNIYVAYIFKERKIMKASTIDNVNAKLRTAHWQIYRREPLKRNDRSQNFALSIVRAETESLRYKTVEENVFCTGLKFIVNILESGRAERKLEEKAEAADEVSNWPASKCRP